MRGVWVLGGSLLAVVLGAIAFTVTPTVYAQVMSAPDRMPFGFPSAGSQIGVSARDVAAEDMKKLKLSGQAGAIVEDVRSGSPASAAGLRTNDVIVEFDGERIRSARQLTRVVLETPQGREVRVEIMREGRRMEVDITPVQASVGLPFQNDDAWRTP